MKNYLVFYGSFYYPNGGFNDFKQDFDALNECIAFINGKLKEDSDNDHWAHVYSLSERKIVYVIEED